MRLLSLGGSDKSKIRLFAFDAAIFIVGIALAKAIQFFLLPLYTTYMTTESYGAAELVNSLSELLYPIVTLCVYDAAFRFAVDDDHDNSKIATAVTLVLLKSVLIGTVIFTLIHVILQYEYALYLLFILYAYAFRMTAAYFARGKGMIKVFAVSGVVNALALAFFNVILLVVFNFEAEGYLLSIGLAGIASTVYLVVRAKIWKDIEFHEDVALETKTLLAYSIPLIAYNVLYWFTTISGRYVLTWFADESTVGLYVAAIKIAAVINMLQQAVYAAFQFISSKSFNDENKEQLYSKINNLMSSVYFIFGSFAILLSPILGFITLRGDFSTAQIFLPVVLLGAVVGCLSSLYGTMYSTYRETKRMVPVSLLGATVNVVLAILLAPSCGIWGICFATLACNLAQVIYKVIDINQFCKLRYDTVPILLNSCAIGAETAIMSLQCQYGLMVSALIVLLIVVGNVFKYRTQIKDLLPSRKR